MNLWKDELDGIAGDFSVEKNRLSKGVDRKIVKKSSRKSLRFSAIISLIVLIFGVFIYQWMSGPSFSKTYSSDSPVYFDEKMYKFYQAILYEIENEQERNNEAFRYLISLMAQEHVAYENGYVFDEEAYEKMLNSIINRYENDEPDEYIMAMADSINMSEERFIKTIAAPLEAKVMTMHEAMAQFDTHLLFNNGIAMYEQGFEKEIHELATFLGVQYKKLVNHFGYTGLVIAKEEGKILVVNGATTNDMESMAVSEIVNRYNTGIWFNMDQLSTNVHVGDTVTIYYETIDHSLPGQADAIDMYIVETAKKEPIYYDESLFYYFTLYYSHIEDEILRHEKAFELYLEWLSIERRATDMGYEINSSMYELMKTTVLDEFETTIGSPPFKETDIIALSELRTLPSNQALHEILAEAEVQQRLIHQYMNGQIIVPYDHNYLTYFKIDHEPEIEALAKRFGINNYTQDQTVPFYIGRIVTIENGQMKIITGDTSHYLVALSDEQIEQMKETALSFEYHPVPRLSVGDIVKIHYDEFKADTPMKPIKISIIKDEK